MKKNGLLDGVFDAVSESIGEAAGALVAAALGLILEGVSWFLHSFVEPKYVPLAWGVVLLAALVALTAGLIRSRAA